MKWSWFICSVKKNWVSLPGQSFVRYHNSADSLEIFPEKGGIYGRESYGFVDEEMPMVKVATLKKIKDNPKQYNMYGYKSPIQVFNGKYEKEYIEVYNAAKSNNPECTNDFACVSSKIKTEISDLCGWYSPSTNKPGANSVSTGSGSGSTNPTGCYNTFSIFNPDKISNNFRQVGSVKGSIYPLLNQDKNLENDFGSTYHDIYLDANKDLIRDWGAPRRYVYASVNVKNSDWDESVDPSAYFVVQLNSQIGRFSNNVINLKTCKNFPNYTGAEVGICRNVLSAHTNLVDGSVEYTVRFPVEEAGVHTVQLVKMTDQMGNSVLDEFQFNAFQSNSIAYNKNTPQEKVYTSTSRVLNLTILDFPNSLLPPLKNCKLNAFNSLEETLEDAYSLNERTFDKVKKEKVFTGVDFKINNCTFDYGDKSANYIIDENQILKIRFKELKKLTDGEVYTGYSAFYKLFSESAHTLANVYVNKCNDTYSSDNNMKALSLIIKEIKYEGLNNELMNVDASNQLELGSNKGFDVTAEDKSKFMSPNEIMGMEYVGYTLPNLTSYGPSMGRVTFVLYDNILKTLNNFNITSISAENYVSVVLAHELGHVWANRFIMGQAIGEGDKHQEYCTGRDECECIFRYDNISDVWCKRINDTGAKYCESHRQLILNQLLRKF